MVACSSVMVWPSDSRSRRLQVVPQLGQMVEVDVVPVAAMRRVFPSSITA